MAAITTEQIELLIKSNNDCAQAYAAIAGDLAGLKAEVRRLYYVLLAMVVLIAGILASVGLYKAVSIPGVGIPGVGVANTASPAAAPPTGTPVP